MIRRLVHSDTHTQAHVFVFKSVSRGGESPFRKTAIKSTHRAPVGTHFRRLKTVAAADRLAVGQQGSAETWAAGRINIHFKQPEI